MKVKALLMCATLCMCTMVFKASDHAKIEKPSVTVIDDCQQAETIQLAAYFEPIELTVSSPAMEMDQVEALTIEVIRKGSYAAWKPFGKVSTKYHSPWLFEPVKLC